MEWINVDDRLPDFIPEYHEENSDYGTYDCSDCVLAISVSGEQRTCFYVSDALGNRFEWDCDKELEYVTHWTPLPPPPDR